jgi:hypothetical protein
MTAETPRPGPDIGYVQDAMHELSESDRPPEPPDTETSEELDVEGPNESAPGHNPEPESEDEGS